MDDLLLRRVRPGLGGELADVRVTDGRVASITEPGSAGFAARIVDGHGGTLLPGLVDAHVHVVQWATSRRRIPLEAARSAGETVELLLAHLLATPSQPAELVVGAGFRDALWPDKPHKELLQRALPGRAVALFSADLHTLWLSPAALKLIGREHPTGVLLENDCMSATAELPTAAVDVQDQWVAEAVRAAAARGVTQIVDYEYADTVTDWLQPSGTRHPGGAGLLRHRPVPAGPGHRARPPHGRRPPGLRRAPHGRPVQALRRRLAQHPHGVLPRPVPGRGFAGAAGTPMRPSWCR